MNTHEVAEYLRLKERKIYDLVAARAIPCTRVTGKWLFSKALIDRWILQNTECRPPLGSVATTPKVIAGSHDPLLEWAIRESGGELALLFGGSLDGLKRMMAGEALVCGLHVLDPAQGRYNVDLVEQTLANSRVILLEWAWRTQGLIVSPGNPLGIDSLCSLSANRVRLIDRQQESGSHLLLEHLLSLQGLVLSALKIDLPPARSETDVALAVLEGKADAGFGIAAVARRFRLDFVPLHQERYDLVVGRRDYFEPPFQDLLRFAHSPRFAERAKESGGYDITGLGRVIYNAP
jgi:excisionase family DNA binding protein